MHPWLVTMSYELEPTAAPEVKKLLRAELAARRWQERSHDYALPRGCVWMRRPMRDADEIVDDVHAACGRELREAAEAVAARGLACRVERAWVHVSGGGMVGLLHF